MSRTCPECGGDANVVREDGRPILECLERDCLHWEEL